MITSTLPSLIQRFFMDRLLKQLGASPHTIAAYRDTFRLLLQFAAERLGRAPSQLRVEDLDAQFLGQFLEDLESKRGNCPRTRNNRLAALHAFFQFVAISEPALALHCQRVLAIPSKRFERGPVEFLTEEDRCAGGCSRSLHMDRQTGQGPSARCGSDRSAQQRDYITSPPRRGVRHRVSCPLPRERSQDAMHTSTPGRRCCPKGMVVAAGRRANRSGLPQFKWRASQRRCIAAPRDKACYYCASVLSIAPAEEGDAAHAATRGSDGAPAPRRRSQRDRSLARSRIDRDDPDVSARRHAAQGASTRSCHIIRPRARPVPAFRPLARLPGEPVIMPTIERRKSGYSVHRRTPQLRRGIIRQSA